ncbi:hypothetical protein HK099_001151 [Clydaea vesicula]|uniref:EF-hand domain-containing protein n=1 Tax=Clydaea vesicula TaxID=447962 RepID=A0AAD5XX80_9FUNG|nr:hypothetical protein HK099_001151 [Clydaea vesicula]KAJ3378535.1 hypothetical protein HDU92_007323 [Lobulomyces angularis]
MSKLTPKYQVDVSDKASVEKAFKQFDYNNNGLLSLAEIDKAVIEILPQFAKDKPAIMRAYKAADKSKDGFIEKDEFVSLIKLLNHYDSLFKVFQKLDTDKDKRISLKEFIKGYELIGLDTKDAAKLKSEFEKIDTNNGGYILFEEFCIAMAKKHA